MRLRHVLAAALVAAAVVSAAAQQAPPRPRIDPERGRQAAAENCAACHGADGRSQMAEVPSLAGQPADFIVVQMILFREGLRQVPAMLEFARGLSDRQIEELGAWFAALPSGPPDDRGPRDDALGRRGEAVSRERRCGICHLPDYSGRDQVPRIARQREDFLIHTMTQYRDGLRAGPDTQMNSAVVGLSEADIRALAHYLAQQE